MKPAQAARLLVCAVALLITARAAPAAETPAPSFEANCPVSTDALPEELDLNAEFARVETLQLTRDAQMLPVACRAWAWALRSAPAEDVARAQVSVGSSLLWAGRPEPALALLMDAYAKQLAGTPPPWAAAAETAALISTIYFQRAESAQALAWSQRAIDAAVMPGSGMAPALQLRLQTNHAALLSAARRYKEAESLIDSLLLQTRTGLPGTAAETAGLLRSRAMAQRRQEMTEAALTSTREEIAFRQTWLPGVKVEIAVAQQNLGVLLEVQARYDDAEQALREAIRTGTDAGGDLWSGLAAAHESLSRLLLQRGRIAEALASAQAAVDLVGRGPAAGTPRAARPLRHLAQAQFANGELGAALVSLRRALALIDAAPGRTDTDTELAIRLLHAQILLALGDLDTAQAALALTQARMAGTPLSPAERARLHTLQAMAEHRRGDDMAALIALDAADAAVAGFWPDTHPQRIELRAHACDWAGRACDRLREDAQALQSFSVLAQARLVLARRALREETPADALTTAREALAAALDASQPDLQWQAQFGYASALQRAGRPAEAIFFGKAALRTLQDLRGSVTMLGPDSEALYLQDKGAAYRSVADGLLAAGRLPEALEVLRLLKRSEQDDFNERALPLADAELSLTAREQAWRLRVEAETRIGRAQAEEIARLQRLQAARRMTADEEARLALLLQEQSALSNAARQRLEVALDGLRDSPTDADTGDATGGLLAGAPRLPVPSDSRTLHVYLLAGPERLSALVIGQRGQQVRHAPVSAVALGTQIATLLDAVRARQNVQAPAQALYAHLGPLIDAPARAWGAQRIVLWLDGPLRYLPVGLLHDGRGYLVERYAISVATPSAAPGATAAPAARAVSAAALPLRVRAWGVTQALAGLPALPGVSDELCGVVSGPMHGLDRADCLGALPGQGDANAYFTEAAWRAAGVAEAAGGVVHVGTHFVLRPGNVSQSWLLLGDGSRLMLERLRNWPLGAPRLLTLSACETAVPAGRDADGREVDGLAATLLGSGAGQVVASLWRVDDRATGALMRRFYAEAARRPRDIPGALQAAQRAALQAGAPAHVWAAFTLSVAEGRAMP